MKEIIVWAIHTPAGTIVLVTAVIAMFAKKGSALHQESRRLFYCIHDGHAGVGYCSRLPQKFHR